MKDYPLEKIVVDDIIRSVTKPRPNRVANKEMKMMTADQIVSLSNLVGLLQGVWPKAMVDADHILDASKEIFESGIFPEIVEGSVFYDDILRLDTLLADLTSVERGAHELKKTFTKYLRDGFEDYNEI